MGDKTAIEWTDATFNPWWGCAKVSPGCDHCYAEGIARRFHDGIWGTLSDGGARRVFDHKHWAKPLGWNKRAAESGKRMRVFCASMADVFDNHPAVDDERDQLWTLIHKTPWLDWQLLTKRVGNVKRMVPPSWLTGHWPAHAWLGISVVNQEEADRDIPKLLELPARIRFLSCEPLLGLVNVGPYLTRDHLFAMLPGFKDHLPGLHWVIAGGESGHGARPMHPDWVRLLRDQCNAAGVPFLFKQWGEWLPFAAESPCLRFDGLEYIARVDGKVYRGDAIAFESGVYHPDSRWYVRVGKHTAGRQLDGRTWDEYPETRV